MNCLNSHPAHISNIFGQMVTSWKTCNPEALKAIHKANEENHQFLFMPADLKLKYIRDMKAANFVASNGKAIDLLAIERQAFEQNQFLLAKTAESKKPIKKKAYQKALKPLARALHVPEHESAKGKYLGEV